jgi:hypothetical protein
MARIGATSVVKACFKVWSATMASLRSWASLRVARSTRWAWTKARTTSMALVISDSMGSVTLCDWSSM